ncbi:MAG TPA: EamA family transporter [Candidatus Limnocylindrales bacterium]|nr:EamA family transporter [Candidatus Limnocylindrales bacterium]
MGPEAATVVFGLLSAVAWGCGDFGGGTTTKRAPVLGVVLIVEVVGAVIAAGLALVLAEPLPSVPGLAFGVAAGLSGIIGILALYQGLAVGRMGVVAPVAGVMGASIPVLAGIALEGLPSPIVLVGIGLGIVAVILVSRIPGPAGGRSGLEFGLAAGAGIAGFNVLISQLPEGEVFWPLAALRLVSIPIVAAIVLLARRPWRVPRPALGPASLVAVFDMAGNAFFILATQVGVLAVAVILSSMYPVVTVLLAVAILRERLTRTHAIGIAVAAVAITFIAGGQAAGP